MNPTSQPEVFSAAKRANGLELAECKNTVLGKCNFWSLPRKYQQAFRAGANQVDGAFFIAQSSPWAVMIMMPFFMLFAAIPLLFVIDTKWVPFLPWGYLATIPLTAGACLTTRSSLGVLHSLVSKRKGNEIYGLLLDDEYLVVRELGLWEIKDCVILPRREIASFQMTCERHTTNGRVSKTWIISAICRGPSKRRVRICYSNWLVVKPHRVLEMLRAEFSK